MSDRALQIQLTEREIQLAISTLAKEQSFLSRSLVRARFDRRPSKMHHIERQMIDLQGLIDRILGQLPTDAGDPWAIEQERRMAERGGAQ